MAHKTKIELIEDWKPGDDPAVARDMSHVLKTKISPESVYQWRTGETANSKIEKFYLNAARRVQKKREMAAVEVQ